MLMTGFPESSSFVFFFVAKVGVFSSCGASLVESACCDPYVEGILNSPFPVLYITQFLHSPVA